MSNTVNIFSETNDGYISSKDTSSYANARDATSGDSVYASVPGSTTSIASSHTLGRGGSNTWTINRAFFEFDVSGITTIPSSVYLAIRGFGGNTGTVSVVKSEQSASLAVGDFDAITGWVAGADNIGNVTLYADNIGSWNSSAYNTIQLTSEGLTDIAGLGKFKCCVLNRTYDLRNSAPSSAILSNGCYFAEGIGTSKDPYLRIFIGDDSNFFGTNF